MKLDCRDGLMLEKANNFGRYIRYFDCLPRRL